MKKHIRDQFPALQQENKGVIPIFLDGPGGSQVPNCVLNSVVSYLGSSNANLGGAYFTSKKTQSLMSDARQAAADLYNAPSTNNIVFGANATSLAFHFSRAIANTWQRGDEIIVTALDHYSNVSPWILAAEEKGVVVHQVPVVETDCTLDRQTLLRLINDKTKFVAVTHASNTTGSIVDVKGVVEDIKSHSEALVYVDAVHYVPHASVDVQALNCDFLVSSAYKYFGPHLGVLFAKESLLSSLSPYKVAPAKDENPGRWETGTQSFEALAGFISAVDYIASLSDLPVTKTRRERICAGYEQIIQHEKMLSSYFLSNLKDYAGIQLFGLSFSEDRTPTFAFRIEGIAPRVVSEFFAQYDVCIWDGNFYAQGLYEQLGLTDIGGVIRVGCMHYNSIHELERFFELLEQCILLHK